ncbi:MAG: M20 family metallopeptidase [Hyphomicrobiaceae bacterium]
MLEPTANELLEGIRRWVEIESQTADTEGVNRVMTACAEEFGATGAHVERIPGREGKGDHLLVSSAWGGDAPGILVLSHLDTVHPRGTLTGELPFRVDGDRAFGPGIYDMKGGAYIAMAAYRAIAASGHTTPLPIRFLIVSDEEIGSLTSRDLIEREGAKAKYVLVTEPAREGGKVVTARKGVARYEIRTQGRPSHAGGAHKDGRSAIVELARQIIAIESMTDYGRGTTLNIGQIKGGTADNVVPEHAWAAIDMRITSVAEGEAMDRRLKSLKPHNPDVKVMVTGGLNRPPFEKSNSIASLFEHARGLARDIGIDLQDMSTGGGSDGNFTAPLAPTLDGLGVDGAGAHTLKEHLLISSLVPRMTLQKRLFETLR